MTKKMLFRTLTVAALLGLSACSGSHPVEEAATPKASSTAGPSQAESSEAPLEASHEDTEKFIRPFIYKAIPFTAEKTLVFADENGINQLVDGKIVLVNNQFDIMSLVRRGDTIYASGFKATEPRYTKPLGLVKSTDMGKTWEEVPVQGADFFVQMASTKSGLIGYDGVLFHSEDEGKTWDTFGKDQEKLMLSSISGSPKTDNMIAATITGLKVSDDCGATWTNPANTPILFFLEFASETVAYGVGVDNSFYRTSDAGKTWERRSASPAEVLSYVSTDVANPDYVATGNADELFVSEDGGKTWEATDLTKLEETQAQDLAPRKPVKTQ